MKWNVDHRKYRSHRDHRYELVAETKKQSNRTFIDKKLTNRVIIDCGKTSAHKFRTKLWFQQYGVFLTKEQSVLTKTMNSFEGEMCTHNIML